MENVRREIRNSIRGMLPELGRSLEIAYLLSLILSTLLFVILALTVL